MRWVLPAVLAASVAFSANVARAATPISVVRDVMTAAPGKMPQSVRCVPTPQLPVARGQGWTRRASGVTKHRGAVATVLLDRKRVCNPLYRSRTKRRVEPATVLEALMTVLHEHAHVQGEHTEWKANCMALPWVVEQVRRWGYNKRQVDAAIWYLGVHLDKGRPSEYRMRGRCVNVRG